MAEPDELRFFFSRRKRFRVGLLSRNDVLRMLLKGDLEGNALIRAVTGRVMLPLGSGELADLLPQVGSVWRRQGSVPRHLAFLLALFLFNGVVFLAVRNHADWPWSFTLLPIVLAGAAGILCWLFLLWRILLGSSREAWKRVLPLLIPGWNLYWLWPGFFALGAALRTKLRRAGLPGGPSPRLFAAVIVMVYLEAAAALLLRLLPSRPPAAVHELLLAGLPVHILTLLLLFRTDRSVMRLLRRRVEQMLDTLPIRTLKSDPQPLLEAELALRQRTGSAAALAGLALLLAGVLPLAAAHLREAGLHAAHQLRSRLPAVKPETPGLRQELRHETANAMQALLAARTAPTADRLAAWKRLADCPVRQQEFYRLFETQEVLTAGAVLVREGGEILGAEDISAEEIASFAAHCEAAERRLRRLSLTAVARTVREKLADLPDWNPVRTVAVLETAELLPECCRRDFYEFLPELHRPAGSLAQAVAGEETARLTALSFFLRANTLILDFRLLHAAAEARNGAPPETLPRNPLTGRELRFLKTPDGFRIDGGEWPGRPPHDRLFRPEITVRVRRGAAE